VLFGWAWKPMRTLTLVVAAISLAAIGLYGDELARNESSFFLKFLISSQSAIMWMSALYVMATFAYYFELAIGSQFSGRVGSVLTWSATTMGLVGLMVRWRESYLISHDVGHIPVSNLYEVFILFAIITALLYLHYERRYNNRAMGAFVLTAISGTVAFLLWYTFERGAHEIQPLVPALQSYWMKIHVPANFVGYGAFALAAMLGVAYLLMERKPEGLLARRLPSRRDVGGRGVGRLLVLGPEGDLGADRLAQLRRLAAPAPDQGVARQAAGLVGDHRPVRHPVRLRRGEHVPLRPAFLWTVVTAVVNCSCKLQVTSNKKT
jgi:hypothetical protein